MFIIVGMHVHLSMLVRMFVFMLVFVFELMYIPVFMIVHVTMLGCCDPMLGHTRLLPWLLRDVVTRLLCLCHG